MFSNVLDNILESSSFGGEITSSKYHPDRDGITVIMKESSADLAILESELAIDFAKKYVGAVQSSTCEADLREAMEDIQEASISGAAAKVKAFFIKVWNKLKDFFKRLLIRLQQFYMKDKDFIKKYKKEIEEGHRNLGDSFRVKVKEVSSEVISQSFSEKITKLLEAARGDSNFSLTIADKDDKDKIYKAITQSAIGKSVDNSSDLKEELKSLLYENDGDATEYEGEMPKAYPLNVVLQVMENGKFISGIKKLETDMGSAYKKLIDGFDKDIKGTNTDTPEDEISKFALSKTVATTANSISNVMLSDYIQACRTAMSACNTVAGKLARYRNKDK